MGARRSDVLHAFVKRGTLGWALQPVPLPASLAARLRCVGVVDVLVALWMYGVNSHRLPCANAVCSITTLGGHETVLGLVAGGCLLVLLLVAMTTGGFRRAGAPAVVSLCVVSLATVAVASGLALAALLVLTTLAVAGLLVLAFVVALTTP